MKRTFLITVILVFAFALVVSTVVAQSQTKTTGAIQGVIYEDVNRDGVCVNTGVAGEGPVADVNVEFVSSDEQTVLTMYSSPDGAFGLFAAGFSYWRLTAHPGSDWVVTSENPIYAPIDSGNPAITGLYFCVQKSSTAAVVLPKSGDPVSSGWLAGAAVTGLAMFLSGMGLTLRRRWQ